MVLAVQPDIKSDESRTLPGVKLMKNEELERWYVINRAGIEGERELNVGDVTNLEELEISPIESDPKMFRAFTTRRDVFQRKDIFYENYKIHVFTKLKDVIDTGTENGYLKKRALPRTV